jgi:hypothetical protein
MRLQILSTELAVTELNTRYQTERLAESLLYEFALKVNQDYIPDAFFNEKTNEKANAVIAREKRINEENQAGQKDIVYTDIDLLPVMESQTVIICD